MSKKEPNPSSSRRIAYRGADNRFVSSRLGTKCVHAGERWALPNYRELGTPIHSANIYFYEKFQELDDLVHGIKPGYSYARWGTPTLAVLERLMSTLTKAEVTLVSSSGMAAIHVALLASGLVQGTKLVCSRDLYGPSLDLIKKIFAGLGVEVFTWDFTDIIGLERLIESEVPDVVYFEVMTNPLLKIIDAPRIIEVAHHFGAKVIIDNTFLTPYIFKPLEHGADYVVHSVSKYLSGHGDVLAGSVSTRRENMEVLRSTLATTGCTLSSNSAWLAIRGIKTFHLRMPKHCENALELARYLENNSAVSRVFYPGLPSHPQHRLAKRIFSNEHYGGMITFEITKCSQDKVYEFIDSLKVIIPAGSLGDVHSLILPPSRTTHHKLTKEDLKLIGIKPNTVRLSVGLEDVGDLKMDLDQALVNL